MKKALFIALAVILAAGGTGIENATAQKGVQLGIRGGIASQDMKFHENIFEAKSRLGWHVAAVSRIRIIGLGDGLLGVGFFLQPEIVYSQNNSNIVVPNNSVASVIREPSKVRMQTIDVPLLLSLKVSLLRVQAGPVFNLMNKYSTIGNDNLKLYPSRSSVGYAVGASVDILGLTIDGRYHGEFKELKSRISDGQSLHESVKSTLSSWSIGIGIMF